ncbi:hypothetical protein DPEC_G00194040 [Dallia pectoralis]|uniref:Uncharacterized protein n=1 Tax=Dallia pectoralis TaxID=75939 RepID=A0ACC2G719_DALPE|nr:hypothetical protein DPEC_G00194040 [Dallia pectoralis]
MPDTCNRWTNEAIYMNTLTGHIVLEPGRFLRESPWRARQCHPVPHYAMLVASFAQLIRLQQQMETTAAEASDTDQTLFT